MCRIYGDTITGRLLSTNQHYLWGRSPHQLYKFGLIRLVNNNNHSDHLYHILRKKDEDYYMFETVSKNGIRKLEKLLEHGWEIIKEPNTDIQRAYIFDQELLNQLMGSLVSEIVTNVPNEKHVRIFQFIRNNIVKEEFIITRLNHSIDFLASSQSFTDDYLWDMQGISILFDSVDEIIDEMRKAISLLEDFQIELERFLNILRSDLPEVYNILFNSREELVS